MLRSKRRSYLVDIDRVTGAYISGWPRIRQSIQTILMTRLKTRLMRLWWGSDFRAMIDKPGNPQTFTDGIIAACNAINLYEPEFKVSSVEIRKRSADGSATITINGVDLVEARERTLSEPI